MRIPFQFENKGKSILGILHIAKHQLATPVVMIMCYGLNGNRVVQNRISVKLGEMLEHKFINLVRFDYRNVGVSEGGFNQSNIKNRVEDIIEVCKYIKSCFYNNPIKIILIGFSDGARNALQVTKDFYIDGLVLWNPIFNVPQTNDSTTNYNKRKLILHPLYKIPIKKLLGIGLNLDMIRQIESENSLEALKIYNNNILLLFGGEDNLTRNVRHYLKNINIMNNNYYIIKNADHLFSKSDQINDLFNITVDWVTKNYSEKSVKINEKY